MRKQKSVYSRRIYASFGGKVLREKNYLHRNNYGTLNIEELHRRHLNDMSSSSYVTQLKYYKIILCNYFLVCRIYSV